MARAEDAASSSGVFVAVSEVASELVSEAGDSDPEAAGGSGELAGVPFAVKDNIDVQGLPTTAGSGLFEGNVPRHDASVVSVLRDAGAWVVGKTNMHELALGVTSNNGHFGPVRHPVDRTRTAGGSSGGSAAAVASGVVPFSLGTDTGASVTLPASFCGVVGFRPTTGRYPDDGLLRISWTRDTVGLHTTTVADAQLLDGIITRESESESESESGAEVGSRPLAGRRIGVPAGRFDDLSPEVDALSRAALGRLEDAGATLVEVSVRDDLRAAAEGGMTVVLYEAAQLLQEQHAIFTGGTPGAALAELADSVDSPDVAGLLRHLSAAPVSREDYETARRMVWRLRGAYASAFRDPHVEALISPTAVALPPLLGEDQTFRHNGRDVPVFETLIRNTGPGTSAGLPMISVPAGRAADGMPVGMLLEGPRSADTALLRLAAAVEEAFAASAR
ncbi:MULTISPECIES: amidase family protein [Actinomycetes]|uniref:Indoleacetamide hydrolase n=2 Tax=Actinomycetes TaxID=1760 RepID=A0ABP6LV95_9MICC